MAESPDSNPTAFCNGKNMAGAVFQIPILKGIALNGAIKTHGKTGRLL
jgi:hypothetical protein